MNHNYGIDKNDFVQDKQVDLYNINNAIEITSL